MADYIKIERVRNLESAIQDCLERQSGITSQEDDYQEPANDFEAGKKYAQKAVKEAKSREPLTKEQRKANRVKIARRISWVFIIFVVLALIAMSILSAVQTKQLEAANKLTDTRLVEYEAQAQRVKNLGLLFTIHDDESYQLAKSSIEMTDELKARYFISDKYRNTTSEITLSWQDILYEITDNDSVNYLLYFTTTQDGKTTQYVVQAEYADTTLIEIYILNGTVNV